MDLDTSSLAVIISLCALTIALGVVVRQWMHIRAMTNTIEGLQMSNHILRKSEGEGLRVIRELQEKIRDVEDNISEEKLSSTKLPDLFLIYRPSDAPLVEYGEIEEMVVVAKTKEKALGIMKEDPNFAHDDWYEVKPVSDKIKTLYVKRRSTLF